MSSTIPRADGFADYVIQHPTLARLHARLPAAVAEHVIVVAHDHPIQGVDYVALITLDVQYNAGVIGLVYRRAIVDELIVCGGKEGASQRIEVSDRGRASVDFALLRCGLLR